MTRKNWIGGIFLVGWLSVTAVGYWWYQTRHLRPYQGSPEQTGRIAPAIVKQRFETLLTAFALPDRSTLVHFSRADCHCNRSSRVHLRDLQAQFGKLQLVQIPRPGGVNRSLKGARVVKAPELWELVPAVPSAAVLDSEGRLVYVGPYSSGPTCGSGINFVEQTLERLQNEWPELWVNDMAFGCFCTSGTYRGVG